MLENNQFTNHSTSDEDTDATLINFDTINLENFTLQECNSNSEEWQHIAHFEID